MDKARTIVKQPLMSAMWIAPSEPVAAPVIIKHFTINEATSDAVLFLSGLGYFEFTLNGKRITNDMFIPPASDYFKRDFSSVTYPVRDSFTHRIYYHKYDVENYLLTGENVLEITLGGGWLVQTERLAEGKMNYADRPMCIFELHCGEQIILSDGTESYRECETRYSQLFIGEVIDYTYVPEGEKKVITVERPDSIMSEAIGVPDRVIRKIKPRLLNESDGVRIYDLGENISGLISLTTSAPFGTRYTLRFSECLNSDGSPDFRSTGSSYVCSSGKPQIMEDVFVTDGNPRCFTPRFTWHAFRYFELHGDFKSTVELTALVIHADVAVKCSFESDSEGLNFLYDSYIRTELCSYHGSFPSDCPHRERLGYTGDGQITARSAMLMLDSKELYRKWIRDILDSQDTKSGHIQHTAPFQGGGGGPGGWCSAVVTVPYAYAKENGYDPIIDDAYPAMIRWIEFTASCIENGLVVRESDGGWCLGDWCYAKEAEIPACFVNTCWFIHALRLFRKISAFLERNDAENYKSLEETCLAAVIKEYGKIRHVGAAMAYAVWIGFEDPRRLAQYYNEKGCFDTGFLGTDILCDTLFRTGYGDVAYKLLSSDKQGSYLYMKMHGATTIWERWHGDGCSHSHPMFGAPARQLFSRILGIGQAEDSFGYKDIRVTPYLPHGMNYAAGHVATCNGKIFVRLWRDGDEVRHEVKYQ